MPHAEVYGIAYGNAGVIFRLITRCFGINDLYAHRRAMHAVTFTFKLGVNDTAPAIIVGDVAIIQISTANRIRVPTDESINTFVSFAYLRVFRITVHICILIFTPHTRLYLYFPCGGYIFLHGIMQGVQ